MNLLEAEQGLRGLKNWSPHPLGQRRVPAGGGQEVSKSRRTVYYNPKKELGHSYWDDVNLLSAC